MSKKKFADKYAESDTRLQGGDLDRIELKDGDNYVRLVSVDYQEVYLHFVKDTEGAKRRIVCPCPVKERAKAAELCPVCALYKEDGDDELSASQRYLFNAIQGSKIKVKSGGKVVVKTKLDNTVKLWDVGPMIWGQISTMQQEDELPDLDLINLIVKKTGKNLGTKYGVIPSTKQTPFPKELTEPIDLEEISIPTPLKDINEIMGISDEEGNDMKEEEAVEEEVVEEEAEEVEEEEVVEEVKDKFVKMDRTELKKFIKSKKLDVVVKKSWTDDDIRDNIRSKLSKDEVDTELEELDEIE